MRKLTAEQVLGGNPSRSANRSRGGPRLPRSGWPIIDGRVIPDDQYKLYEAGRYNETPILVGYNSDEGLSFGGGQTPEAYVESVRQRYGPFADRLLKLYPTERHQALENGA